MFHKILKNMIVDVDELSDSIVKNGFGTMVEFAKYQDNFWTALDSESVTGEEWMFDEEGVFLQPKDRVNGLPAKKVQVPVKAKPVR